MLEADSLPTRSEVVFTAPFDREVRVAADRRTVTHRAMAWSARYSPDELLGWLAWYEERAERIGTPMNRADVEVLRQARDLLAREAQGGA